MIGNGVFIGQNSMKPGYFEIDKFGENSDIDTNTIPVGIHSFGGEVPFLDSAISMSILSSLASDNSAGTGARTVLIQGLLYDNTFIEEEIILDGITPVLLSNSYKAVTRMFVQTSGSLNVNVGNIDIVDTATGLIVYQRIPIGESQTLSAFQLVEKGKQGIVKKHYCTYARQANNQAARLRLRVRLLDGTVVTKYNITIDDSHKRDDQKYSDSGGIHIDEGQWVFWECVDVTANNTPIEAGFNLQLWEKL